MAKLKIKHWRVLFMICGWLVISGSYAETFKIESVHFDKMKYNDEHYLRKVIGCRKGITFDSLVFSKDVKALLALPSIKSVKYDFDTVGNTLAIHFAVEELITAYPIFNAGLIEENVWFTVGYGSLNLFKMGHQIKAKYQLSNGNHNVDLFYKIPYWGNTKWGNSISATKYGSAEPLMFDQGIVNYDYEIKSVGLATFYNFTNSHYLEASGAYFTESYGHSKRQNLEVPLGPKEVFHRKGLVKLKHVYKNLTYVNHRRDGWSNCIQVQHIVNPSYNDRSTNIINDFIFHKIMSKRVALASRFHFGLADNKASPFAPFVLDSYVNIRGVGNRIDRGTGQAVANIEIRYDMFRAFRKIITEAVLFSDHGNWRKPGGEITDLIGEMNYKHFVGGGFRFIYDKAYNYVARVDYGIDVIGGKDHGIVVGVGQYF